MVAMSRIALLLCATLLPAIAQDASGLADLTSDPQTVAVFAQMARGHHNPDWVTSGAVTAPAQTVGFDGKDWLAISACQPHNCAAQQVAVISAPDKGKIYGVLSDSPRDQDGPQIQKWLSIGRGAESIDGRTILFAALSRSLANHPASFDYNTR